MNLFQAGRDYSNVYIIFVDAAGHSTVVANNTADLAGRCYDVLENSVLSRFQGIGKQLRCANFERWGWQGDGGMFVVHDKEETVSLNTSIEFGMALLDVDLRNLKSEFDRQKIKGDLHLRISIHKGALSYIGDENRGSIHSTAINQAAHLEKITPKDCLSITKSIYDVLSINLQHQFEVVGEFEGNVIAVHSPELSKFQIRRRWCASEGFGGAVVRVLIQRPSEQKKAEMLGTATSEVIDLGTALRTCSRYLTTTQRPALFRDAVLANFKRGVKYKCFLLNPEGDICSILSKKNNEDLKNKIVSSLVALKEFVKEYPDDSENLEIYTYDYNNGISGVGVDMNLDGGTIVYSPQLGRATSKKYNRADLPHYVVSTDQINLYNHVKSRMQDIITDANEFNLSTL